MAVAEFSTAATVSPVNHADVKREHLQAYPIPTTSTLSKKKQPAYIYDTGAVCSVPDHWKRKTFIVNDIPISYYIIRADDERGVMVGRTGMKSDRPLDVERIEEANANGISVIMQVMPNMGRSRDVMAFLQKVHERFALDPSSPVHTKFHPDLPKFLYSHSTSGQFDIDLLTSEEHKPIIQQSGYREAFTEAPYLDTAGASLHDSWIARNAFKAYASIHNKKIPRETLGGLFYLNYEFNKSELGFLPPNMPLLDRTTVKAAYLLNIATETVKDYLTNTSEDVHGLKASLPDANKLEKISLKTCYALRVAANKAKEFLIGTDDTQTSAWYKRDTEFRTPTYGQILDNMAAGRKISKKLTTQEHSTTIPLTVYYADDDPFSSAKAIKEDIVGRLKAAHTEVSGGQHNPLSFSDAAFNLMLDKMRPHLLTEPLQKTEEELQREEAPDQPWTINIITSKVRQKISQGWQAITHHSVT